MEVSLHPGLTVSADCAFLGALPAMRYNLIGAEGAARQVLSLDNCAQEPPCCIK